MNNLSFVITARNDNYGLFLSERINAMILVLSFLANKYKTCVEIIIVEYNPPKDTLPLKSVIKTKTNKYLSVRIVKVDKAFHLSFSNSSKNPLFEYIAKNIGIRRAKYDYVISTNQDILISEELFLYLISSPIDTNVFYRTDRCDTLVSRIPTNLNPGKILKLAKNNVFQILSRTGVMIVNRFSPDHFKYIFNFNKFYIDRLAIKQKITQIFSHSQKFENPDFFHTHAAGDFLMMHKVAWNKVCGYDERPLSNYLDSYILYSAMCHGLKQHILDLPIYHVSHVIGKNGRPSADLIEYKINCSKMMETKIDYKIKNKNWGFPNYKFLETTIL